MVRNNGIGKNATARMAAVVAIVLQLALCGCSSDDPSRQAPDSSGVSSGSAERTCWVVSSVEDSDVSNDGYYFNEAYTYDDAGNWVQTNTVYGNSTQATRVEGSCQNDAFGNMVTRTITFDNGTNVQTTTDSYDNTVDDDGRLLAFVTHSSDDPDVPGEESTARSFEYYPDGTVKRMLQHDTYEYMPNEEPEYRSIMTAERDATYSFDQSGLIIESSIIRYQYDDEYTTYEESRSGNIRDKCTYTYQWTHGADGSINGMVKTRQSYDYLGDDRYLANYEPVTEEWLIETDENGNILRVKNGSTDRSLTYKEISNPSVGAYARARMREDLYFLWY